MSATSEVAYHLSQIARTEGETDEKLARRMFYLQMEIYSANAATTLYQEGDFELLPDEVQKQWLEKAHQK